MLELRPICENCAAPLPPDSTDAMICSFECTFCAGCVEGVLQNVCPNCGGGFTPRPVRPAQKLARRQLSRDVSSRECPYAQACRSGGSREVRRPRSRNPAARAIVVNRVCVILPAAGG